MSSHKASSDNCGCVVIAVIQKSIKLKVLKALYKDESLERSIDNTSSIDLILILFPNDSHQMDCLFIVILSISSPFVVDGRYLQKSSSSSMVLLNSNRTKADKFAQLATSVVSSSCNAKKLLC